VVPTKLAIALVTGVLLFGSGAVAAAALADEPIPTEPTTTTETTTTTATTTATTSTETVTTSTEPPSSPAGTTTASPPSTTVTSSAPRRASRTQNETVPERATASDKPPGNGRVVTPQRRKHRRRVSKPLKVTPPLGLDGYVFPVVGASSYGDSYGAFRGDVHGKWHHGDDIFAPLGTPVVAVANGTINRVGWHRLGGWRLWVRDTAANQFYYAHLSGYAPGIFHSRYVRAGDVLGFVGTTGDAYGGAAHLHFEVHPHQLLRRRYDGAVDPTTYLNSWARIESVRAPFPMHPRFPRHPGLRTEARVVFRHLLVARHLIAQPTPTQQPAAVHRGERSSAPPPHLLSLRNEPTVRKASAGGAVPTVPLLAGLLVIVAFVATCVLATIMLGRTLRNGGSEVS
jgi:murein DD-endopeptidase MepM/ murein hydrolase activator NlpD